LDLSHLAGIVEYNPGDLTITALAGTPLQEIQATTAARGQWLPLDPPGSDGGSIGATLATASEGPLAGFLGRPRDLTIGLAFVSGDGKLVEAGGRVVKNVAGFDLVRLCVGSWGTLGAIVRTTLRLRALPAADESWALDLPESEIEMRTLLERLIEAPLELWAAELVSAPLARRLGAGESARILVRLGGGRRAVASQLNTLRRLGTAEPLDPGVWRALRAAEQPGCVTLRLSSFPAHLPQLWMAMLSLAELGNGETHASLARGIGRTWICPHSLEDLATALRHHARPYRCVFERLPAEWWRSLAPPVLADPVSQRLRAAFDPWHILNPGILREDVT
jgi:glycolate oxidase FAD binding subunit